MKTGFLKNIVFIDKAQSKSDMRLQESIKNVIEKKKYEWITLRVEENGAIKEE
jgi:hypothetical protein